ncbi:MAG: S-layer homology domain-containing protein [Eubacterium sp.]|nr:S-layer homology domain-containing protein [Eubacterium sp.]
MPEQFFYKPVLWAYENGITFGKTKNTFESFAPCTRGQFVSFLYRLAGEPDVKGIENRFYDVNYKKSYYNAVLWADANSITSGTSKDRFSPDSIINRA